MRQGWLCDSSKRLALNKPGAELKKLIKTLQSNVAQLESNKGHEKVKQEIIEFISALDNFYSHLCGSSALTRTRAEMLRKAKNAKDSNAKGTKGVTKKEMRKEMMKGVKRERGEETKAKEVELPKEGKKLLLYLLSFFRVTNLKCKVRITPDDLAGDIQRISRDEILPFIGKRHEKLMIGDDGETGEAVLISLVSISPPAGQSSYTAFFHDNDPFSNMTVEISIQCVIAVPSLIKLKVKKFKGQEQALYDYLSRVARFKLATDT